ncbi:MAG: exosortase [Verrucomicrobiales bacterium]|jgi:exosortase
MMNEAPVLLGVDRANTSKANTSKANAASADPRLVRCGVVILLSYLPFLLVHFAALWQKPHYQYFPFLLVAIVILVKRRWEAPSEAEASRVSWSLDRISAILLGLSLLLLLGALLIYSPPLGALSFVVGMGGCARLLAKQGRLVKPFGLWSLLWLMLPLPTRLDAAVMQWLNGVTTMISSKMLDITGRFHVVEGYALTMAKKTFFVDQASGRMASIMGMLAVMLVIVVWRRRSVSHSLLLIASAVFWACFLNVICVMVLGVAWYKYGVDLNSGGGRDLLAILLFLCGCFAGLSTDALFEFLFTPLHDSQFQDEHGPDQRSPLARWWNRGMKWQLPAWNIPSPQGSVVKRHSSWGQFYLVPLGVFGILQMGLIAYERTRPSTGVPLLLETLLTEETLVPRQADWTLTEHHSEHRDALNIFGEHAVQWTFQAPGYQAVISLDYRFPEWHELTACYADRGWEVDQQSSFAESDWGLVESHLHKPSGERGFLLYSLCNADGQGMTPPPAPPEPPIWKKVHDGQRLAHGALYQVQAWVHAGEALTPEQEHSVRQEFLNFRNVLRKRLQETSASVSS